MTYTESENTELKLIWKDDILKAICAFANSSGGEILVGIDDSGKVTGLENTKKLLEDIPNKVRNKLGIIPSVLVEKNGDIDFIKIIISPSNVPVSYDGRYFIRSGSVSCELKHHEVFDFLLKKSGRTWDGLAIEEYSINDIDPESVRKFQNYAIDRIPSITQEQNISTILSKLNLLQHSRLNNASILLFGNNTKRHINCAFVKIGKFISESDILTSDIVEGNLFEQTERTLDILRTKYLLSYISYEGLHRREILEYPYEALREAILNALIHRKYNTTTATQIRIYENKLVIINEGQLPSEVKIEDLNKNHVSKPINPIVADVFYKAGYIESWGRGTLKIIEKCRLQGLPDPLFEYNNNIFRVTFFKHTDNSSQSTDNSSQSTDNSSQSTDNSSLIIGFLKEHETINNETARTLTGLSPEGAKKLLKRLEEAGVIIRSGKNKATVFYLNETRRLQ